MPYAKDELRRALFTGAFIPYFQPQVDLRSGELRGFEVLARWHRVRAGVVGPDTFVDSLERMGLMNELTLSLFKQSLSAVRTLPGNFGLSLNLSPAQLHDRTLPDFIARLADEAHFDLKRLTLELTESALIADLDTAATVAAGLKRLGVQLSLDDFGTGYSSLLHLQALPFDELKIDLSFVRHMVENPQSRKITAAVCSLGMSLGMRTVAEGIENEDQARLLVWQGGTLGQGYLYGKPMPTADLAGAVSNFVRIDTAAHTSGSAFDPLLTLESHPMAQLSQLRAIYDSAPVGLAFVDREMRYIHINQKLAQANGNSVQAHLGRYVSEMVQPVFFAQFEPYIKRALAGEIFPSIEVTRQGLKPGDPDRHIMLTYHPVRDEAGDVLGVCIAVADISVLRQQQAALLESEDRYHHAVELNPQIPWTMNAQGEDVTISSRWDALTGTASKDTHGLGWLESMHPDDQQSVAAAYISCMQTGDPIDVEFRILSKTGAWVWMRSRATARRDAAGQIVRWYGTLESVDEHKRAAEQLRTSAAELRSVLQTNTAGMVVVEAASRKVLSANSAAVHLLGFTPSSDTAWPPQAWAVRDARGQRVEPAYLPVARALLTGQPTAPENLYLHRPDGSRVWLNVTAIPICLEHGKRAGAVLMLQDAEAGKQECARLLSLAYEFNQPAARSEQGPAFPAESSRLSAPSAAGPDHLLHFQNRRSA